MSPMISHRYAPGMRVLIRDCVWMIRRVDPTTAEHSALSVTGISEIVRGRESIFLTAAEREITILDPAKTSLVPDDSPKYLRTRLALESQLRKTPPTGPALAIGHRGAMDVLPFQLEPAWMALQQPRPRILIADTVGLGKTLEAGILVSELIRRGRGKRILVVTVKSVMAQFQKEWWARFSIPLRRLDSQNLQRVRNNLPTHQNPFHYYDRTIVSIDTLKQDNEFRNHLEQAWWDIIVIDEAHNVARRGTKSQRSRLADMLASRSDALLLLSATPHDGNKASFASLMNMLDPTAIANPDDYSPEDIQGLYVRRFRKDVAAELATQVPEREVDKVKATASFQEREVFEALDRLRLSTDRGGDESSKGAGQLFRTSLLKGFLSSPQACLQTLDSRLDRVRKGTTGTDDDRAVLEALRARVAAVGEAEFSKVHELCKYLRDWKPAAADRLVIFTERIETLKWLQEHLPARLKLKDDQVAILHGTMEDTDQMAVVKAFGQESSKLRLLIASDVASEGINLHYQCHRLVHFDLPWSLMIFAQRNGRIDRYGQKHQPRIAYLLTCDPSTPRTDERVLELLVQKDEQARVTIGDPSALVGTWTVEDQEKQVADIVESGKTEVFEGLGFDPFELLLQAPEATKPAVQKQTLPSLFASDHAYAAKALGWLALDDSSIQHTVEGSDLFVSVNRDPESDDLSNRFALMPPEVVPNGSLCLSGSVAAVQEGMEEARRREGEWPRVQYLWPLHPVLEWIDDRVGSAFGRHEAPVVLAPTLRAEEALVLVTGLYPNRLGHPLVHEWVGIHFVGRDIRETLPLEAALARCGLASETMVNPRPAEPDRCKALEALLPQAIAHAKLKLAAARKAWMESTSRELAAQESRLDALRDKHSRQIEMNFAKGIAQVNRSRREEEEARVERAFQAHKLWLRDAHHLEDYAHFTVLAVCTGA